MINKYLVYDIFFIFNEDIFPFFAARDSALKEGGGGGVGGAPSPLLRTKFRWRIVSRILAGGKCERVSSLKS